MRRDFNKSVEQVNELRRQQREIQLDPDLTPEDKRLELDDIQREINDVASLKLADVLICVRIHQCKASHRKGRDGRRGRGRAHDS